jgi:hypothetical protein
MDRICSTYGTDKKYKTVIGKPEGKDHLGHLGVDGRITLICILQKGDERCWIVIK